MKDHSKALREAVEVIRKKSLAAKKAERRSRLRMRAEEVTADLTHRIIAHNLKDRQKYVVEPHDAVIVAEEELPQQPDLSDITDDREFDESFNQFTTKLDKLMQQYTRKKKWVYVMSGMSNRTLITYCYNPLTKLWYKVAPNHDLPTIHGLKHPQIGFPKFSDAFYNLD